MAKRHRKRHHDDHIDESWLIPYADLLTLLLALFIVLFASSTIDAQKLQQMSQAFNEIFEGSDGAMEFNTPVPAEMPLSETSAQSMELSEDQESLQEIKKRSMPTSGKDSWKGNSKPL